jgi:hypothetical protein
MKFANVWSFSDRNEVNKIGDAAAEDPTINIKVAAVLPVRGVLWLYAYIIHDSPIVFTRCVASQVRIMKATNLPAKDGSGEKGTCDAYVKVICNAHFCIYATPLM